jgi:serpin B
MITRRNLLALAGLATLAACGGEEEGDITSTTELVSSDVTRAAASPEAREAAVRAVTAFTADLYGRAAAAAGGNLVMSPLSVAVALGMTVQGARGRTAAELLAVLHGDDAGELASGLNGIDAELARRPRDLAGPEGKERLELATANSLWGQRGTAWDQDFIDGLGREFGSPLYLVDYRTAAEKARAQVNAWVSERTRKRIPELVPGGVFDAMTRLTLVNAVWFKAPWQTRFKKSRTAPAPFHRVDGSTVAADLMSETVPAGYATGDGWTAVDLPYGGGQLAMAVVLPDAGRFAEVERGLGTVLPAVLAGLAPQPVAVQLPRWTSRTQAELKPALAALGMPTAFTDQADFSGMTRQEALRIAAVIHEGFVAVDEDGTEAAAATAVVVEVTGAAPSSEVEFVADRPFLYVIHDVPTRTPLFVGRVLDPTVR